jgi:hypothetical protein
MFRGRVHQHVSPFQQQIFKNYIKDIHKRLFVRARRIITDAGPAVALYSFIYFWAKEKIHHNQIAERD